MHKKILATVLAAGCLAASTAQAAGWETRGLGAGRGTWDTSVGVFFWENEFQLRNLQWRADVDLTPGLRWHAVVRSNREQDTLTGLQPHFDEHYLEAAVYRPLASGEMAASLRVGETRYLRFAEPGRLADFDQVPGIGDLRGGAATGYSGAIAAFDYDRKDGWGLHATGIRWGFGREGGTDLLEDYLRYRKTVGRFIVEGRYGELAVRPEPLGSRAEGYAFYAGTQGNHYDIGVMVESLSGQPTYTGIQVLFPLNTVTKAAGRVAFDYDRDPEGFAMQLPLVSGRFGDIVKKAPEGAEEVGRISAKRVRTYWQNGQVRNYYEQRLAQTGEAGGSELLCVMEEGPWHLAGESLVSPHTALGSHQALKDWESDRQGPAQIEQTVTYHFYHKEK